MWNTAGLKKDKDFWRYIKDFEFVSLVETWVEEKDWANLKERLPDSHEWKCVFARRIKKKGRAKGGMLIGRNKEWGEEGSERMGGGRRVEEGITISRIARDKKNKDIIIVSIYFTGDWDKLEAVIRNIAEEERNNYIIIGGDFNIRTGEENMDEEEGWKLNRKSKDKISRKLW